MRPYRVYIALGTGPYKYSASYATEAKAEQVCASWRTRKGAVNGEPFKATWKIDYKEEDDDVGYPIKF